MEIGSEGIDTVTTAFDLHEVDPCLEHFLSKLHLLCHILRILMRGIDDFLPACLGIFDSDQCEPFFRLIAWVKDLYCIKIVDTRKRLKFKRSRICQEV